MFWIYGSFDIVTFIFCHLFCMLYHVWVCSCHPCDITLLFSSLSLPFQLYIYFVNWLIIDLPRLSKVNQHLESHQFIINQVYQIRKKIWQDINYKFTESRKSKLGEIWFSVVWFRLVHSSVQSPTLWWSKSQRGLIGTKGILICFSDIVAIVGK